MQNRIRAVRYAVDGGLSQEKFAENLGVTGAAISRIEAGTRGVTDAIIKSICRTYGVDEAWLRTGEGEMFVQPTRAIAAFVGSALSDEEESFKRRLLSVLSRLDEKEWQLLEKMAKKLAGE